MSEVDSSMGACYVTTVGASSDGRTPFGTRSRVRLEPGETLETVAQFTSMVPPGVSSERGNASSLFDETLDSLKQFEPHTTNI